MKTIFSLAIIFFFAACVPSGNQTDSGNQSQNEVQNTQVQFLNNLGALCGFAYKGEELFRSPHGESWAEREMIMYVADCGTDHAFIPFHIDDDKSRTWMFTLVDGKLRFQHQHLHDDGTPEEGSMYGGWATEDGTALRQFFPADEYTASVIPGGGGNLWIVEIASDLSWLSYRLDRDGEKRFELRFDLNKKIDF